MLIPLAAIQIVEFGPTFRSNLGGIVFTKDGSVWVEESDGVVRISPNGRIAQKRRPGDCAQCDEPPGDIRVGRDDVVTTGGYAYRAAADGGIAFANGGRRLAPASRGDTRVLASGSDGATWSVSGPEQNYFVHTPLTFRKGTRTVTGIAADYLKTHRLVRFLVAPDDSLIALSAQQIVRISPDGTVTPVATLPNHGTWWNQIGDWKFAGDGSLWLTETLANRIARIAPDGRLTEYRAGIPAGMSPNAIAIAPDGSVWFDDAFYSLVIHRTADGAMHVFGNGLLPNNVPGPPAPAADGSVWFYQTLGWHARLTRLAPDGSFREYPQAPKQTLCTSNSNCFTYYAPSLLTAHGDDAIIVAAADLGVAWARYEIRPDGRVTKLSMRGCFVASLNFVCGLQMRVPANVAAAYAIVGPDGALWFTDPDRSRIGRVDRRGKIVYFTHGLTRWNSGPQYMTIGRDGAIWFTEIRDRIGRIAMDGSITEFSHGIPHLSFIGGIVSGPDGNLWFTLYHGNELVRMTTRGVITRFRKGIYPSRGNDYNTADSVPLLDASGRIWFNEPQGGRLARAAILF